MKLLKLLTIGLLLGTAAYAASDTPQKTATINGKQVALSDWTTSLETLIRSRGKNADTKLANSIIETVQCPVEEHYGKGAWQELRQQLSNADQAELAQILPNTDLPSPVPQ
ncbi:MAG: hypothetical protein LBJ69_01020 [Holosporales bacterium]|jgi:hypothetical protein|nr:hypothetical protein [Holosporales bacterium]